MLPTDKSEFLHLISITYHLFVSVPIAVWESSIPSAQEYLHHLFYFPVGALVSSIFTIPRG